MDIIIKILSIPVFILWILLSPFMALHTITESIVLRVYYGENKVPKYIRKKRCEK